MSLETPPRDPWEYSYEPYDDDQGFKPGDKVWISNPNIKPNPVTGFIVCKTIPQLGCEKLWVVRFTENIECNGRLYTVEQNAYVFISESSLTARESNI